MCDCDCCISAKCIHSSMLTCRDFRLKHLKDRSHNVQNIRSSEISSRIFVTYRNAVQPHGYHITASIVMAKICLCTSKHNGLPQ